MGACYTVYADFIIADEDAFLDAFRGAMDNVNAEWHHELGEDATAAEAIEMLIPRGRYEQDGHIYRADSDFDASYGWGDVMASIFEDVAPTLGNGSYLECYPDNDTWRLDVVDGEIVE